VASHDAALNFERHAIILLMISFRYWIKFTLRSCAINLRSIHHLQIL